MTWPVSFHHEGANRVLSPRCPSSMIASFRVFSYGRVSLPDHAIDWLVPFILERIFELFDVIFAIRNVISRGYSVSSLIIL